MKTDAELQKDVMDEIKWEPSTTAAQIGVAVTHGKGLMGAAGPLMTAEDRWATIAYLRALQLSWLGTTNDLTK